MSAFFNSHMGVLYYTIYIFDAKGGRCSASKNFSFELMKVCTNPGLCAVKNHENVLIIIKSFHYNVPP